MSEITKESVQALLDNQHNHPGDLVARIKLHNKATALGEAYVKQCEAIEGLEKEITGLRKIIGIQEGMFDQLSKSVQIYDPIIGYEEIENNDG